MQVISNLSANTGPLFLMEGWGRFPTERIRLFDLIKKTKVSQSLSLIINSEEELLIFISAETWSDVH